jgi:hypothetical protein
MSRHTHPLRRPLTLTLVAIAASIALAVGQDRERQWLAGDSHIHSQWSPGYDRATDPPTPVLGRDAIYPTPVNARRAKEFGLQWMVTTDHGGPNHSKLNLTQAYEELKRSRHEVPAVLQFYGMELNMPAMDHHTLIIPRSDDEWKTLFNIESQFDADEAWPPDPRRDSEAMGFQALTYMKGLTRLPLMFANHPSRSATGVRAYGLDEPREFRANNDVAPEVYHGMEGGPGHQAGALAPDGSIKRDTAGNPTGSRGGYGNAGAATFGGFDQMTARVGGLWDALLGEGRRFWIVATSDSHANYTETSRPSSDFWPGQFHKTYVYAHRTYDDVLDGLRHGRVFAVAGDLVSELALTATAAGGGRADIGGTLRVPAGTDVTITIQFRDPDTRNAHGDNPRVARIDLITGDVRGQAENRNADVNDTAKVIARYTAGEWRVRDGVTTVTATLPRLSQSMYVRVRGTSGAELEPSMDPPGEDPWSDLWLYTNPVFIDVVRETP